MADTNEPHSNVIAIYGVVTSIILFLLTIAIFAWYNLTFQKWKENAESQPNTDLAELRNHEAPLLTTYSVNSTTAPMRIPIEIAMELEAKQPWRPRAAWPAATPTPVPTPTPAATPAAQEAATTHGLAPAH